MTVTDFIPECDGRKYDDIIKEIEYLAEKYTPEWKFSPDNPDAGTALACVFAHRMSETIKCRLIIRGSFIICLAHLLYRLFRRRDIYFLI